MKLIYVAGPFTGETRWHVERNIQRAEQRGLTIASLGAMPVVPHSNTSHPCYEEVQPYTFWIEGTMELLKRCDAVLTCHDWEKSKGARGEIEVAVCLGLPVFHTVEELRVWLQSSPSPSE